MGTRSCLLSVRRFGRGAERSGLRRFGRVEPPLSTVAQHLEHVYLHMYKYGG